VTGPQPGAGDRQPEAGGLPPGAGPGAGGTPGLVRLTAWVEGRVQGVGFRWWVRSRALELGLSGTAENLPDGRVKIVAEGPEDRCQELLRRLQGGGTPGLVRRVTERWAAASGSLTGFVER
jgi:acylphosphatase